MSVTSQGSSKREGPGGVLEWFFGSWRFAAFAISLLAFFSLLILGVLLIPPADKGLGSFAAEFKTWCFGYDPATGKIDWSYVFRFFSSGLMLAGIIAWVWGKGLREAWSQSKRAFVPFVSFSLALVCSFGVGFAALYEAPPQGALPFPAEALRTTYTPPPLALLNQHEKPVTLRSMRGKVVLITAVYSTCGYTCPMIFAQMKRAFAGLTKAQRSQLRVLALSLDPKRDRPRLLRRASKAHQLKAPFFHFLTGPPAAVNQTLDRFGFARKRDPKTGQIDHVNLFLLVDANGRLAYRFSLGKRQERWLTQALRLLLNETRKLQGR